MKILLVDDHNLVRRGIAHVIRECFDDAEVVEAETIEEAMEVLKPGDVNAALLDVRLSGDRDGLDLLHDIKAKYPDIPVIMLTTYDHAKYARRALAEGAAGYMLKDSSPSDLAQAVRVAMAGGGNVLSSRVITSLFEEDAHEPERGSEGESEKAPVSSPQVNLTAREIDILSLVAEGQSNRDVAAHLFLSEKTVKAHLASIFRKMGVTNRTQAAMAALDMGIGPSHENAPAHLQPRQPQA